MSNRTRKIQKSLSRTAKTGQLNHALGDLNSALSVLQQAGGFSEALETLKAQTSRVESLAEAMVADYEDLLQRIELLEKRAAEGASEEPRV